MTVRKPIHLIPLWSSLISLSVNRNGPKVVLCVWLCTFTSYLPPWVYVGISTKFLVLVHSKKTWIFCTSEALTKCQTWRLGFQPRTCRNLVNRSSLFYHYARSTRKILRFPKQYQLWFSLQNLAKMWQNTRKWCGEVADISVTSWIPVKSSLVWWWRRSGGVKVSWHVICEHERLVLTKIVASNSPNFTKKSGLLCELGPIQCLTARVSMPYFSFSQWFCILKCQEEEFAIIWIFAKNAVQNIGPTLIW